jgi:hypothetical protein
MCPFTDSENRAVGVFWLLLNLWSARRILFSSLDGCASHKVREKRQYAGYGGLVIHKMRFYGVLIRIKGRFKRVRKEDEPSKPPLTEKEAVLGDFGQTRANAGRLRSATLLTTSFPHFRVAILG